MRSGTVTKVVVVESVFVWQHFQLSYVRKDREGFFTVNLTRRRINSGLLSAAGLPFGSVVLKSMRFTPVTRSTGAVLKVAWLAGAGFGLSAVGATVGVVLPASGGE